MSRLFANVRADFHIIGEAQDRRTVTSDKAKDWCLYILKIAAKGCTLEIQVEKDVYDAAVLKEPYQITGSITCENNRTKLIGEKVELLQAAPARAA